MKKSTIKQSMPNNSEMQYIEAIRKMTYQQRIEKFCAIYELSYLIKNAKKVSNPYLRNE